jgi:glutathione S-transferase
MKLFYSKGACSLAVRIVIHEIGIPCQYESVNIKTKKTETGADFYEINPKGSVPVLMVDDKEFLTENAVIQQYLADQNQAYTLLPPMTDFKRYRVLEWLNFVSTDLHKGFGPLFNPNVSKEMQEQIFIPALKTKLNYVEKSLGQKKYLLGDTFTLADAYLFVILTWLAHFKIDVATWPNLHRYFTALKERKSIQQALKEESLQ